MWVYNQRKNKSALKGSRGKNLFKGRLLCYIRYITKNALIMFMYARNSMVLIRIRASSRRIKQWKKIIHERKIKIDMYVSVTRLKISQTCVY